MADLSFFHGVRVSESAETPVLIRTAQSSVVALTGTAPDADAEAFPLDTPVLIKGAAEISKAAALGEAGTLKAAVDAVFDQVGTFVYVIRVEDGDTAPDTLSNLVGDAATRTGVHALKKIEGMFGRHLKPRLVAVPGFTGPLATDGVTAITVDEGGSGYTEPPAVTIAGDGNGAEAEAVLTDGAVSAVIVTKPGFGYSVAPTVTIAAPGGEGVGATATATVGTVANPVVAELIGVLESIRAVAFIDGPDTTDEAAVAWRETFQSDRLYPIDPKVLVWDTELSAYVPQPASPRFAGVQARVDRSQGFWWSVSNKPINGIGGVTRPISYGDQANYLNEAHVNTIIAGDDGGWITWGNRMATGEALKLFISVRRTTDFINEAIERAYRAFNDRPMTAANVKMLIESGRAFLQTLKAETAIYDGDLFWDEERNTDVELAQGRVTLGVRYLVPPPMEDIRIIQHYEISYFSVLRDGVLTEQGTTLSALAR